jgi:hypothetical protein
MHSLLIYAWLALLPQILAHEHMFHGLPRAFGLSRLKHRDLFGGTFFGPREEPEKKDKRATSSNTSGACGAGVASCAAGYCCSPAGWCGKGTAYCAAPDCQINYGPGCDANTAPTGPNTTKVVRTQTNPSILYGGAGVYACTVSFLSSLYQTLTLQGPRNSGNNSE